MILSIAALLVTACAGNPKVDARETAYYQAIKETQVAIAAAKAAEADARAKEAQARRDAYADVGKTCETDSCKQITMMGMALGDAVSNVGSNAAATSTPMPAVKQYTPQPSGWEKFGYGVLKAVTGLAPYAVQWHQSDNATETTLAQYGFLTSTMNGLTTAVGQMAPSITVGNDYITGTSTNVNGDQIGAGGIDGGFIGGDVNGNGSGIGNTYSSADTAIDASGTGNAIGDGNDVDNSQGQINGDGNRFDSPGPFEDSNNDNSTGPEEDDGFGG